MPGALGTALRIGSPGCGFEQHLHAIRRARLGNAGFWRSDASTAIVALVDEDDCSVLDPHLFEPDDALGPLSSYRCTRHGVVCDQSLDAAGAKTNCRPDLASKYIEDPALTKTALESATLDPARTTVSVIAGPPTPFAIETRSQGGQPVPALAHGCSVRSPTGDQVADPAPRLAAPTESFASRGSFQSICEPNYDAVVARIAKVIERSLGIACFDDALDVDLATCTAHDVRAGLRTELPRCPSTTDCFDILPDSARCGGGLRVTVDRKSTPAATTHVEVACARSSP